eukprot:4964706-Pleurochrysis_carterae.AAC.1
MAASTMPGRCIHGYASKRSIRIFKERYFYRHARPSRESSYVIHNITCAYDVVRECSTSLDPFDVQMFGLLDEWRLTMLGRVILTSTVDVLE